MSTSPLATVSLKFIDIMVGVILGLGFQWWPNLIFPWQYLAFVFSYVDIVDYWIDYSPALKKFPPKKEVDVFIDVAIMFAIFLYVYSTQLGLTSFLLAYLFFCFIDSLWLLRAKHEYPQLKSSNSFITTWLKLNAMQIAYTLLLLFLSSLIFPFFLLLTFIGLRIGTRILASLGYRRFYFI